MTGVGRASGAWLKQVRGLFRVGTVGGLSDGQLLDRFVSREGDDAEAAFEALMHRHGPMVLRVCRRVLRDSQDAEDAFQAAFLVLANRAGSIRRRDSVASWLFGVSQRVAAQARLRAARRRNGERIVAEQTTEGYVAAEVGDEAEALLEEIDRLPDRLRNVVVLCYLEGLTYDAAGQRLGLSEGSIRGRLARARDLLRRRLTRRGVTIPAGLLAVGTIAQGHAQAALSVCLPDSLVDSTIRMTLGFKAGEAAAVLARGVLKTMLIGKLKAAMVVLAAVLGSSMLAWQTLAARDDDSAQSAPKPQPPRAASAFSSAPKPGSQAEVSKPEDASIPGTTADSSKSQPRTITIEARDLLTDTPVLGVQLHLVVHHPDRTQSESTTDASGNARFALPDATAVQYLHVTASRDGLVPVAITWRPDASSRTSPDRFLFQMEEATTVGGRVLDQDEQPVAGATVVIGANKRYPKSPQWVNVPSESTQTDATGRWSISNVPEQSDSVSLAAHHHLHLGEHPFYLLEEFKPLSGLREGSAVLRLQRGTLLEGQVLAPDGRPVPDAEVFYGEGRRYGNSIPPVKTDAHGRFTMGIKPGTITILTAQHAGFGPAQQFIRVGTEPQKVTLALPTPHQLSGRVVDGNGKSIARAELVVSWSGPGRSSPPAWGSEAIALVLTTDSDGRFVWNDAPDDGVFAQVGAAGYLGKDVPLTPGAVNRIVLVPPTTLKGKVVDAETGAPIPRFSLVHATIRNPGERLIWQRGSTPSINDQAKKAPGSFECTFGRAAQRYLVRVEAEGYLPADSELFEPTGAPREFSFRLTKAEPIRGTLLRLDGSPAPNGVVYLVPAGDSLNLFNGDLDKYARKGAVQANVSSGGRFSLPPQKEDYLLLVLADAGFAIVHRRDLPRDNALHLQPWARVSGTVRIGTRPAAKLDLHAQSDSEDLPTSPGEPRIFPHNRVTTDADGRFTFARLMPGHYDFIRWVPNGMRRITIVNMAALDVVAGQSYDLKIGGSGRPVTGRLALPATIPWMVRKAAIESRTATGKPVQHGVQMSVDGRFRAENIGPGDYQLRVSIHEPPSLDQCGWGRLVGEFSRAFTVPSIPGMVRDDPLDLGTLEPAPGNIHPLHVGDTAPNFTVKTLDGKDLALADLQGKFVLLDFWATWCAPCVVEIPNLKAVHEAFAAVPRFAMVSLSLDERAADARFFVNAQELNWTHGFLGPDSPVAAAYDATAVPATFLIGPDGKILAKDLRGAKIKMGVAEALQR
jgi:RNA polymerase sigma factor (sigma-70 family)